MSRAVERIESLAPTLRSITGIPHFIYNDELSGVYSSTIRAELAELIDYYDIYEQGCKVTPEGSNGDYIPSQLRYKQVASVINKEARFMFSKHPDFWVTVPIIPDMSEAEKKQAKADQSVLQGLVDKVLEENNFYNKLIKAAKDCFIGKRVALFINFNEKGIKLSFSSSLEFIFETDPEDVDTLTKLVTFYSTVEATNRTEQRIYKKKYYMHEDGFCHIVEELYDGLGNVVDTITQDSQTKFQYIPAFVIINDGLTGDIQGVSEVAQLKSYEESYSKLANADQDAERKGMNPVRYAVDMNPRTTKGLSTAAGAFWDLASDDQGASERQGTVGVLTTPMEYSGALTTTLERIRNNLLEQVDMPNVSPESLKGIVSSGKTLKAIYWGLITRCDEKMHAWQPALKGMLKTLIDGAKLYPELCARYLDEGSSLPETPYDVKVENQYSLPEDEAEEKQIDLAEVNAQTMSKRAYMKKWRGLTDEEAMEELKQIALERELLQDSFMPESPMTQPGELDSNDGGADDKAPKKDKKDSSQNDPSPEGL